MDRRKIDIAVVGGGLAGGLIALALRRARPDLAVALVEAGNVLGGNHRWSWFASDLSANGAALMQAFEHATWHSGYDVRFPHHTRALNTPYHSLASTDFDAALRQYLPAEKLYLGRSATTVSANDVTLSDGTQIAANAVIDCCGFQPTSYLEGGWQVFLGQRLRFGTPHGLTRPIIMDATLPQLAPAGNGHAYRFVYVLPLGERELFIEDTYYADEPSLDRDLLAARIAEYAAASGWHGDVVEEETGVLPVITGGDFTRWQNTAAIPGVARAGAGAGFTHPLTSYTLPFAVETALAIANTTDHSAAALARLCKDRALSHWRSTGYYRMLGRMLMGAALPERRVSVFERFYSLPDPLIERFYAAKSPGLDRARILMGKPPVPLHRALCALASRGPRLSVGAVA
ncbi:lycopene beta-cyclase CrtY [Erythrobacteraceae bacterium E2-1 Yellow Sea]|nr:lycopene beta-cyclase CrtY [Erythrobacteraceae bacterium E2-1 Yellow Sea]